MNYRQVGGFVAKHPYISTAVAPWAAPYTMGAAAAQKTPAIARNAGFLSTLPSSIGRGYRAMQGERSRKTSPYPSPAGRKLAEFMDSYMKGGMGGYAKGMRLKSDRLAGEKRARTAARLAGLRKPDVTPSDTLAAHSRDLSAPTGAPNAGMYQPGRMRDPFAPAPLPRAPGSLASRTAGAQGSTFSETMAGADATLAKSRGRKSAFDTYAAYNEGRLAKNAAHKRDIAAIHEAGAKRRAQMGSAYLSPGSSTTATATNAYRPAGNAPMKFKAAASWDTALRSTPVNAAGDGDQMARFKAGRKQAIGAWKGPKRPLG